MTTRPGRRQALLLLAGVAASAGARAQTPPATPAPPVARPVVPPSAIDKTKAYYVFFEQNIDIASMRTLRQQLANLVEAGVSEITLVIASGGGQIEPALIAYSFIQALPAKINTHAEGFVQSAATLLYLAGEERSADRNAQFVFHPSQATVSGLLVEEQIRERLDVFRTIVAIDAQIYHDRTKLPDAEFERFTRETVTYTAEQARGFGIVQTVADLRLPGEGRSRVLFLN